MKQKKLGAKITLLSSILEFTAMVTLIFSTPVYAAGDSHWKWTDKNPANQAAQGSSVSRRKSRRL